MGPVARPCLSAVRSSVLVITNMLKPQIRLIPCSTLLLGEFLADLTGPAALTLDATPIEFEPVEDQGLGGGKALFPSALVEIAFAEVGADARWSD